MDLYTLYHRSVESWADRVNAVLPEQWDAPTPCREWSVRDLTNHVAGEDRWTVPLMRGSTMTDVGDALDGDLLGEDPIGRALAAAAEATTVVASTLTAEGKVHLSYGDESCREYLTQMLTDTTVHGWDIARATGQDEAIDPEAASYLLAHWQEREAMVRGSGIFGDAVDVPADAPPAERLLGLLGRNP